MCQFNVRYGKYVEREGEKWKSRNRVFHALSRSMKDTLNMSKMLRMSYVFLNGHRNGSHIYHEQ